ncbi:MAG: hypothetical protein QOH80_1780 [Actinomycetota bacterium]|jgi:hypothetical protein|nr:hypothetical protein [Actinomycetota bacterium]
MGLGGGPTCWEEYEWVRLADLPATSARPAEPLTEALVGWVQTHPLWIEDGSTRVLLVDLDNLRAEPVRLRARLAAVVELARGADRAAFAGQTGSVERSRPWLAEFASEAEAVGGGSDEADWVLLDAAEAVTDYPLQFIVVSNDWIFAGLARRGPLILLSPGADALSDRLKASATRVVDLVVLEQAAAARQR